MSNPDFLNNKLSGVGYNVQIDETMQPQMQITPRANILKQNKCFVHHRIQ